jgi:DnaJ-class molecular chaperone
MYDATKITCSRCRGKGYTGHAVVYAGAPGTCFKCAGFGEVYKDKFYAQYGVGKKFFGVTEVVKHSQDWNPNNGTFKSIATKWKTEDICNDSYRTYTAAEITEEQARKFFARYGTEKVRVVQ